MMTREGLLGPKLDEEQDHRQDLGDTCNNEIHAVFPSFTPVALALKLHFCHILSLAQAEFTGEWKLFYRHHASAQPPPPSLLPTTATELPASVRVPLPPGGHGDQALCP